MASTICVGCCDVDLCLTAGRRGRGGKALVRRGADGQRGDQICDSGMMKDKTEEALVLERGGFVFVVKCVVRRRKEMKSSRPCREGRCSFIEFKVE